jgi:flagellar assembly factor FliW
MIEYYPMKKEILEKELQKVLDEALKLQSASELQLATVVFLHKEADKLMAKMEDPILPYDEKEEVTKQMSALQKRLEHEMGILENDIPKMTALESRLNELNQIQVED